ncbi:MAG: hypothetical protein HQL64_14915 [Magnetococcales bacterium]|nr:hypothetical protein [Magnetococcales bacterium]
MTKIQDPKLSMEEKETAWQQAMLYNKQALVLNPGNAEYWLQFGQFQYLWSRQIKNDTEKSAALLQDAASSYEAAARMRPTWGYTWINLAQVRMVQGKEHWAEAVSHLERAMVLAPWEPSVQQNVVRLGFVMWSTLDERMQNDILNVAVRGMVLYPQEILDLVKRYEKRQKFQPLVRYHPKLRTEFDKYFGTISSIEKEVEGTRP